MKRTFPLFLLSVLVLALGSCKDEDRDAGPDEVLVRGQYMNSADQYIVLESISPSGYFGLDTTKTDEKGHFRLRAKVSDVGVYRVKNDMNSFLTLILAPGETVRLKADAMNVIGTYEVEGSKESSLILSFEKDRRKAMARIDSLGQVWDAHKYDEDTDSLRAVLDSVSEQIFREFRSQLETFIQENKGSMASLFAVYQRLANRKMFVEEEDLGWFELVAEGLGEGYPGNPHTTDFRQRIDNIRADLERRGMLPSAVDTLSAEAR